MPGKFYLWILTKSDRNCYMADTKKKDHPDAEPKFIISNDEMERLKRDIYRSDVEKFHLFTQMLRTNNLLKKAKITHK